MKRSWLQDKRGISEIVSYVLLIVIAISISALVFNFLSDFVPKGETPGCPENINIILKDYSCSQNGLNVTLTNKGLFSVDGVYIRLGETNRKVKSLVNEGSIYFPEKLEPQDSFSNSYFTEIISGPGYYGLELEPTVFVEDKIALCENSVITQTIECS